MNTTQRVYLVFLAGGFTCLLTTQPQFPDAAGTVTYSPIEQRHPPHVPEDGSPGQQAMLTRAVTFTSASATVSFVKAL